MGVTSDEAAQAAFKANAQTLAPKYRTETLQRREEAFVSDQSRMMVDRRRVG